MLAIFDQDLVKGNGRADAHVLTIAEEEYPAECGIVLRQLREAIAEEEVRRTMEGEDLLLRDSMLLGQQVEHQERRAERAEQEQKRAERTLARAIRRLHGLGQDADAIAAALAVDVHQVRRVLSA